MEAKYKYNLSFSHKNKSGSSVYQDARSLKKPTLRRPANGYNQDTMWQEVGPGTTNFLKIVSLVILISKSCRVMKDTGVCTRQKMINVQM